MKRDPEKLARHVLAQQARGDELRARLIADDMLGLECADTVEYQGTSLQIAAAAPYLAAEVLRLHQVARKLDGYIDERLDAIGPGSDTVNVHRRSELYLIKNRLRELLEEPPATATDRIGG